jgi:ParB-like chromosome segregation protein Spo0J
MNIVPQQISIKKLKAHPRNELIYGQEDVSDLKAQIKERGKIIVPIIINTDNVILSGHRRWASAKELGYTTVPYEVRSFDTPDDELEFIVHSNTTRKKSNEQIAREGMALEEVLASHAQERRNANLKQFQSDGDDLSLSDEDGDDQKLLTANNNVNDVIGRTRDEVAKTLKISSGKQFDRMKAVIKKADEFKSSGDVNNAELLLAVFNRSISAAHNLLEFNIASLSEKERDDIQTGKIKLSSLMNREKKQEESVKHDNSYNNIVSQLKQIETAAEELKEDIIHVNNETQKHMLIEQLNKQIENLQNLLSRLKINRDT